MALVIVEPSVSSSFFACHDAILASTHMRDVQLFIREKKKIGHHASNHDKGEDEFNRTNR